MNVRKGGKSLAFGTVVAAARAVIVTAAANTKGVFIYSGWVQTSLSGLTEVGGIMIDDGVTFVSCVTIGGVRYDFNSIYIDPGVEICAKIGAAAAGNLNYMLDYEVLQ